MKYFTLLMIALSFPATAMEFCQNKGGFKSCQPLQPDTALVTFSNGETVPLSVILRNIEQDDCKRPKKHK